MIRSITFWMALAPERTSSILVEILVAVSFFCSNSSICFVVSSINATVSEASASKLTAGVEALLDVAVDVGAVAEDVVVEEGEFVVVVVVAEIAVADVVVEANNSSSLSSKICRASFLLK